MGLVDVSRLPKHVAIIMDGNGRWAQARGKPRTLGHERGADAVRATMRAARHELVDNEIRLSAIGRLHKLPERAQSKLAGLSSETESFDGMTLTLALSYGGREELIDASRELARQARNGEIEPDDIDEKTLDAKLPSMRVGPVDLLIRTGGEQRISNFLLWGSAYAELYFTNELWPDFDARSLYQAIEAYQGRERRFGLVSDASPDPNANETNDELERAV